MIKCLSFILFFMYPENSITPFIGTGPLIFFAICSRTIATIIETPSESLYFATILDLALSNCLTSSTYRIKVSKSRSSLSQMRRIAFLLSS